MTKRELIFDIITIVTKFGYTDDSKVSEAWIGYKIDEKREKEIRDTYNRNPQIDPMWVQDFGICDVTTVTNADDINYAAFSCEVGKLTLPPVVSFGNQMMNVNTYGIFSIRSIDGKQQFYYKTFNEFADISSLSEGNVLKNFKYFTKIGNSIYLMPIPTKIHPYLILQRPLDGYVIQTENIQPGFLIKGQNYTVKTLQIIHNSVPYVSGQSFTAVNKNFIGSGTVQFTNQKRRMTDLDEYPMPASMCEVITMKILTQEFGMEEKQIADIKNDSQALTP